MRLNNFSFIIALIMLNLHFVSATHALDTNANDQPHPHGISASGFNTQVNYENKQFSITGGIQKGNNLFHSFERFNVHSDEHALFHDEGIQNTFGRVTGSQYSWVNGQISSQAQHLYLMNPNGWIFGPDTSLDIAGSFHVTSADYLILGDNGRLDATNPEDTILTSDPISSFGFLDNDIGTIKIEGKLEVNKNMEIELIGGDIDASNNSFVSAANGKISAVSVKSQKVVNAAQIEEIKSNEEMGTIKLTEGSTFSVSGEGDGEIYIRSGNLILGDPNSNNRDNSGYIENNASGRSFQNGSLSIHSESINIYNNSNISCQASNSAKGAHLSITTKALNIFNGGKIDVQVEDNAYGGGLDIISDQINIIGDENFLDIYNAKYDNMPGIIAQTIDNGIGSNISIHSGSITLDRCGYINMMVGYFALGSNLNIYSDTLSLNNGAKIDAHSYMNSASGKIYIETQDDLHLKGEFFSSAILMMNDSTRDSGTIEIHSKNVILDSSRVVASTNDIGDGGNIHIVAEDSIKLFGIYSHIGNGTDENDKIMTKGNGGEIKLEARNIFLTEGSQIETSTIGTGKSGDIIIVSNLLHISGEALFRSEDHEGIEGSGIFNSVLSDYDNGGDAGKIKIKTDYLALIDGGKIDNSNLFGTGNAGQIYIDAKESVAIKGTTSTGIPSYINSISGDAGKGGEITLITKNLFVDQGGKISTSTSFTGDAGIINIHATEKIKLSGKASNDLPSTIFSGSEELNASGNGGEINVTTHNLLIENGASISSKNRGSGKAGNINIDSGHITDIDDSAILLETNMGNAGDIDIQSNTVLMKNSKVSTSVLGFEGNGGNIYFDNKLIALNKSQIIANAHEGTGGNITLNANHLIRSADSTIDASSKLGIHGHVNLLSPEMDFSSDLSALPAAFIDASQWLDSPCDQRTGELSSFIVKQRDALPQSPDDLLTMPIVLLFPDSPLIQKIKPLIINGQQKQAIDFIETAMTGQSIPQEEFSANIILANNYMNLGFKDKARSIIEQTEQNLNSTDQMFEKALFYAMRGDLFLSMGKKWTHAESDLKRALKLAHLCDNPLLLSSIHNKLANCYAVAGLSQNSYDFAWNHYTKAINYLPDKYKLESAVVAINQARISLYHFLSFNTVNIEKAMTHTIHRLEQLTDNWHKGFYLLSVYQLIHHYIERYPDNKEKWINQANQLLEQFRLIANSIHHPQLMAYAHGYYGRNLINTLYAIQSTQKAIFISADNHLPELQYFFQWQLARLQHKAGHIDLAIQAYEQAIKTLIPVQHQFFSAGRFKNKIFVNAIQPMFMELVHLKSKRTDSDEKLFQMLSLVEQLKIAELTNFFKDECIKEKKGSDKLQSYVKRLTDCVIVYPILSDPPIMIVLQESGPKQIALHIDLNQLKTNARHFYQRLIQGNKESRIHYLGNKLYTALIDPLAPYLNNIQTIVFVPDGILRMIPFAALYDLKKHRYLCQDYSVVTLPALTLTKKSSRFQPPRILLGGMSLKKHGFSKLPNVSHELATIHQIMGGTILKDQLFTLSHVKNELANNSFNILHFCTHGTFGNDPDSIQLNTFSKPINLNHLANLVALCNYRNQPIELMTLSACNTASGDERSALGLGGMAVKTGVASAIASLWKVEDLAASTMMKTFYQAFHDRKGNKAQCLQNAQKEMIQSDQFSHPSFWAPFIFIGDWH